MEWQKDFKRFDQTFFSLTTTMEIEKHTMEAQDVLSFFYNNDRKNLLYRTGTLMNAIFTQNLQTFLLSRRIATKLFKNDKSSKFTSLSSKEYSYLLAQITNSNAFEILRPPSKNKAGVYKLVSPQLVAILEKQIGRKVLQEQEASIIEFYDSLYVSEDSESSEDITMGESLNIDEAMERMRANMRKKLEGK